MSLASLLHFPWGCFHSWETAFRFNFDFSYKTKQNQNTFPPRVLVNSDRVSSTSRFSACWYGLWSEARLNSEGSCWRSQLEHQRGYRKKEEQKELERRGCVIHLQETAWLEVVGVAYLIKTLAKWPFLHLPIVCIFPNSELEELIRKGKAWHLFQSVDELDQHTQPGTGLEGTK